MKLEEGEMQLNKTAFSFGIFFSKFICMS